MIYRRENGVVVRDMRAEDAQAIADAEIAQGWHASPEKYLSRLRDSAAGRAIPLVAECDGRPVGYISVYPRGAEGGGALPEIVDFGVLEAYRRQGIGSLLMDVAEALAGRVADEVRLGVGLHSGYGSAQRMYAKRGYIPDGAGAWYGNAVCPP